MKSPVTTICGALAGVAGAVAAGAGNTYPTVALWAGIVAAAAMAAMGVCARDNGTSDEAAGAKEARGSVSEQRAQGGAPRLPTRVLAFGLLGMFLLAGCNTAPPGVVFCHTYKIQQVGFNLSSSLYENPSSQSPAVKMQLGTSTVEIIPTAGSSNGVYVFTTPVYSSGLSVGQNGKLLTQSGNGWTATGPVATFFGSNVTSVPATNWNAGTVSNNVPK